MTFIRFFQKKDERAAQNIDPVLNERLTEINERLRRIENRQKETGMQLEEIDGFLQGGNDNDSTVVNALTTLADAIWDFYCFAASDADSPLFEQARMMWNTAKNAAEEAELEVIDACYEPFDFHRHSVESAEQSDDTPNGHVIKILKCGYVYKGEIIRQAAVVVNKAVTN